jgi:hypothetical protein
VTPYSPAERVPVTIGDEVRLAEVGVTVYAVVPDDMTVAEFIGT